MANEDDIMDNDEQQLKANTSTTLRKEQQGPSKKEDNAFVTKIKQLEGFQMHGWQPDSNLSDDENYMDIVMLVTRTSQLKQGSMACIIVKQQEQEELQQQPKDPNNENTNTEDTTATTITPTKTPSKSTLDVEHSLLSVATNQPLYTTKESDVHAEIVALGSCARRGCATEGATTYITMPPCKRCFAALVVAGIKRIVTRYAIAPQIAKVAEAKGIELVALSEHQEQRDRINSLVQKSRSKHGGEKRCMEDNDITNQERQKRQKEVE